MVRFDGRYADGRTAELRSVTVEIADDLLVIVGADERIVTWRRDEVRIVEHGDAPGGVRVANQADPHARLSIEDDAFLAAITERWPELAPPRRTRHVGAVRLVALSAGAVAVVALLFTVVLPNSANTLAGWVPAPFERRLGERVEKQVEALLGVLDKPSKSCEAEPGIDLMRGLTKRLAAAGGLSAVPTIRVLDSGIINALALPGGKILVLGQLIRVAQSPDELAGVIAHEIGHIKHHHATRHLVRTMGLDLLVGMMTGGGLGTGNLALALVQSSNTREAEAEADEEALAMLSRAGIDSGGMTSFFERLAKKEHDGILGGLFASHPPSGLRARHAEVKGAPGAPALTAEEWQQVRRVCGGEKDQPVTGSR